MNHEEDIAALAQKLRRELRNRFILWPVLIVLFGATALITAIRMQRNIETVAEWRLAAYTSPELIRWAAIQGNIPIIVSFLILTVNLIACGYCLVQLLRPRNEAKLLLAMIERRNQTVNESEIPTA